jgi:hypothetical protein
MLMLFEKQKRQSSHPFGMLCTYRFKIERELVIKEKVLQFNTVCSLVGTRSV